MVCIAAFIILCVVSVFVAFISIFKPQVGKEWWKIFKKAWHCVFKKVRLQKCDTNFKDDVKNTILKRVILKRPKLVKPLSILIEVLSVALVAVVVWSILTAIKSLLALWALGTCNVTQPSQCGLGAETCTIDSNEPTTFTGKIGRWFTEWGDIFGAVPDRLKEWKAEDYIGNNSILATDNTADKVAIDIVDPGCSVCLNSYRNQKSSDFFKDYKTYLIIYPIKLPDGTDKFNNSTLIARYIYTAKLKNHEAAAGKIIDRIFTEKDKDGKIYQNVLINSEEPEAHKIINSWLIEFGLTEDEVKTIENSLNDAATTEILEKNANLVEHEIHAKGIPVEIYDGRLHNGLYKTE